MKTSLLDYTGIGHPDPSSWAARHLVFIKNTRLQISPTLRAEIAEWPAAKITEEIAIIRNTIRSSWVFVDYTFIIEGVTRAFTHQLVRTRTASYAQQAMRVTDQSDFTVETPETISVNGDALLDWETAMACIKFVYRRMVKAGIPAQDARGLLPTNIHTNIVMKCNLRTLADLAGKRLISKRAQDEYQKVVQGITDLAVSVHPWVRSFLFPPRLLTPHLDSLTKGALPGSTGWEAMKELDTLKAIWG